MDVLLLMGGASAEREISLLSGKAVQAALLNLGHHVTIHDHRECVGQITHWAATSNVKVHSPRH